MTTVIEEITVTLVTNVTVVSNVTIVTIAILNYGQ